MAGKRQISKLKIHTMKKIILAIFISLFSLISYAQKDTAYALVGKLPEFNLLYLAIQSPGDVTPNQSKFLLEWLNKLQMILPDTVKKAKKP